MKKRKLQFIMVFLLILLSACSSQDKVSGLGNVSNENSEHRIIATTVAITEIMDKLELDLVGIPTSYKQLPERYKDAVEVGNVKTPDLEIIKYLKPTDVLNVSTLEYDLKPVYEEAGIEASFLNLDSVENMLQTIEDLGAKYDRKGQAEKLASEIRGKIEHLKVELEEEDKPTVLILLGIPGSYLVATEHSYIGNLVHLLGGKNVITGETVEYVATNTEYLQQANPDVILRAAHGMPEEVVKMFDKEFRENDIWKHFDAVKNGRVYDLEEELFGTTGNLAVIEAMEQLKQMLYPE